MNCYYCQGSCIRKGKFKLVQKYQCKQCKKYRRSAYCYRKYSLETEAKVTVLSNEGLGIRSIGRVLLIPRSSVQSLILRIAGKVNPPLCTDHLQEYEMDEMHTYITRNHFSCYTYIIYAINKSSRQIIDYIIGSRNKENIGKLINKIMALSPKRIYTDKLATYNCLIPSVIHR